MKINHMSTAAIQAALHSLNNPKSYDDKGRTVKPGPQSNSAYAGHLRSELKARGAL